jgi:hypothetical protein
MGKDAMDRWNQTIDYIKDNVSAELAKHINTVVTADKVKKEISAELSLGDRKDKKSDKTYDANTKQRHALRGLFMCQRVYYSPLWAGRTMDLKTFGKDTFSLPKDWKAQSQAHWQKKTEKEILDGIRMFVTKDGAKAADLSAAAKKGPPNGKKEDFLPGNLFLSRADGEALGQADTCYNGVVAWLLLSGIVSMRWLMRDTGINGEASCNRMFGEGVRVWDGELIKTEEDVQKAKKKIKLKEGFIYHMWMGESGIGGWNGHWVIANSDGTICGVNNGEDKALKVLKKYTKHSPFFTQFSGYYEELKKLDKEGKMASFDPPKFGTPYLAEFDPLKLKDRM